MIARSRISIWRRSNFKCAVHILDNLAATLFLPGSGVTLLSRYLFVIVRRQPLGTLANLGHSAIPTTDDVQFSEVEGVYLFTCYSYERRSTTVSTE